VRGGKEPGINLSHVPHLLRLNRIRLSSSLCLFLIYVLFSLLFIFYVQPNFLKKESEDYTTTMLSVGLCHPLKTFEPVGRFS
jgi:hypothetical protein